MRVANGDTIDALCGKTKIRTAGTISVTTYERCERGFTLPFANYLMVAEELVRVTRAKSQPADHPLRQAYEALKEIIVPHAPEGNAKIAARLTALFS